MHSKCQEYQNCHNKYEGSNLQSPNKTQMRVRICSLVTVETNFLPITLQSFDSSVTAMINSLSMEKCCNKANLQTFYKMFNNLSTGTGTRHSHLFKLIFKKNPLKYSFLSTSYGTITPRPCE